MATIKERKPLKKFWDTASVGQYTGGKSKVISVAVTPKGLELKLKETRKVMLVAWESIYFMAVQSEVEAERRAKGK